MTLMAFRGIQESIMDSLRIQRGVQHIGKLPTYFDQMPLRGHFYSRASPERDPGGIS